MPMLSLKVKRELELFFAALRFFTRIPVPAWVGHSDEQLNHATRYFPLVGILVGFFVATATVLLDVVLPLSLAILLGMVASLLLTGAFHEDGFADAVDGFGGGWEKQRILDIMKDSRVGSYGAIAIALLLLVKFTALKEIAQLYGLYVLFPALVAAHALSRLAATTLVFFMDYVREDITAKSKPMGRQTGRGEMATATVLGLAPAAALVFIVPEPVVLALALVMLATALAGRYFHRHIGGYTGDCLGATQQLTEVVFYLGLLCTFS